MYELIKNIQNMCHMKTRGGRCITFGGDSVYVYDVAVWTNDMTYQVQKRFPACEIHIKQDFSSLSGFIVVIQNNAREPITCNVTFFLLVSLFTMFVVRYIWAFEIINTV